MNQSVANLPRFIKDRVETTYRMSKHVALGLHNRYRVDVFTGIKLFKSNLTNSYQNKYDKAIFPLYKSHENGQGRELVTDKRQNIFSSKMLWFKAAGLLILAVIAIFICSGFSRQTVVQSLNSRLKIYPPQIIQRLCTCRAS